LSSIEPDKISILSLFISNTPTLPDQYSPPNSLTVKMLSGIPKVEINALTDL
jgi:hypothetical protein